MQMKTSRLYEITNVIDNWLENWNVDSKSFNPNSFDFESYFLSMKLNKKEAKHIKELYEKETTDYNELANMPSDAELELLSEYDRDQWLQLKEGYSHIAIEDVKAYQTAIDNLLTAIENKLSGS